MIPNHARALLRQISNCCKLEKIKLELLEVNFRCKGEVERRRSCVAFWEFGFRQGSGFKKEISENKDWRIPKDQPKISQREIIRITIKMDVTISHHFAICDILAIVGTLGLHKISRDITRCHKIPQDFIRYHKIS